MAHLSFQHQLMSTLGNNNRCVNSKTWASFSLLNLNKCYVTQNQTRTQTLPWANQERGDQGVRLPLNFLTIEKILPKYVLSGLIRHI